MYRDDGDQQTGEGGFDGRRWSYKLVEIVEKTEEYRSPSILILSYSLAIVSMFSMWSRDSKLTRDTLCIYIYIFIKFPFIRFCFFFSTLLYLIFIADHVLKNRSNLRYLRDARFNLLERWRQIASDLFYSRSSREITFFFEKNNQAAFSVDGRRNIWLKSEA